MRFTPSISVRLEADAERVRRNHDQQIAEIQALPVLAMTVIKGVVLPPGVDVIIAHGLGREASVVSVSPPTGNLVISAAGVVRWLRGAEASSAIDDRQVICLHSTLYVETITINVMVF